MVQLTSPFPPGPDASGDAGENARVDPRSNVFVVAVLDSDHGSGPVRIRNMSRAGALIEGAVLPPVGTKLRLSRGSLCATGEVVWRHDNRAGVRFDVAISVPDWLPRGAAGGGQQYIDEIVHAARSSPGPAPAAPPQPAPTPSTAADLAPELLDLQRALERAAGELAKDAMVRQRHMAAIQAIDDVAHKLAQLTDGKA